MTIEILRLTRMWSSSNQLVDSILALVLRRCAMHAVAGILASFVTASLSDSASAADVTYDSLSSTGRPSEFYELNGMGGSAAPAHCKALADALNEPYLHGSYDLKDVLLFNKYAVQWQEQDVFRSSRFLGKVFVSMSSVPSAPSFLLNTADGKDNPVDELYSIRSDELEALRREDGKLDSTRLIALLRVLRNNDRWLVPRAEWQRAHDDIEGEDATAFSPDYYWANVVTIKQKTYLLFVSPPAFDNKLKLRGVLDIFLAPASASGTNAADCRLTHPQSN